MDRNSIEIVVLVVSGAVLLILFTMAMIATNKRKRIIMEDNNKKEENAAHWDDYAGTWVDRGSVQVETTEEQREKLREMQQVLQGIKVEKREPSDAEKSVSQSHEIYQIGNIRTESLTEMMKPLQQYTNIMNAIDELPEELQVEIATKVLDRAVINKEVKLNALIEDWNKKEKEMNYNQIVETANYFMQVVEDSQGYSALEQIKESLRILQIGYEVRSVPEEGIHINWPPISIEYMIKGIENSIQRGYQLKQQDNGTEEQ